MRIAQEEIFGPTTALISVDDFDEAIEVANGIDVRPLVVDLHARRQPRVPGDARPAERDHVRQRRNDRRRGPPAVRRHEGTGNGHREAGQAALDVFTEWKSIYVDYSGRLQRAQIDNV